MNYIRYIDKAAAYYKAAGYDKSYDWAHFDDVPFATLNKPLSECRVALASTSEVTYKSGSAPDSELVMMEGGVYSIPADTPVDNLHSPSQVHDIHATNLDDVNSFFPITRLQELAQAGRIRDVAKNTYGVGTSYSQQTTADVDGPEVLRRCPGGRGRCRAPGASLTRLSPDRESGRTASRGERYPDRHHWIGTGHY